jgi:hypothetical protein
MQGRQLLSKSFMLQAFYLYLFIIIVIFSNAPHPEQFWIAQGIQKLQVLGSVLYVAAHPDDENTRLLAYLSKEKLYRTGYLAITRVTEGKIL